MLTWRYGLSKVLNSSGSHRVWINRSHCSYVEHVERVAVLFGSLLHTLICLSDGISLGKASLRSESLQKQV